MIYRFIPRDDPTTTIISIAVFNDGTNHDQLIKYLQSINLAWGAAPQNSVQPGDFAAALNSPTPDYVYVPVGSWLTPEGAMDEATVRATYFLADDELHL